MFDATTKTSFALVFTVLLFRTINTRSVNSIFLRANEMDFFEDLEVSAAEPRPVFVESVKHPYVLPLISEDSAVGDSPVSDASENVEKILRRPKSFSYTTKHNQNISPVETEAERNEGDQKEAGTHYISKEEENDDEINNDEQAISEKAENREEISESEGEPEESHDSLKNYSEISGDDNDGQEVDREVSRDDYSHQKADSEESQPEHTHIKLDHKKHTEDKQAEGSHHHHKHHHKDGGDHEYKKGGEKNYHSEYEGIHEEKGDKGYKGKHHNEKGEKGHHIKENHDKHYDEHGEHDKKHQHEDGYHAEHSHGEKGHKGSKFEESGEHEKGHSTKGVHNIHKTDEFEKKQEFYDESHEGGDSEKHGEYFHEDNYKKGGHEKGGHKKGAKEEAHYGKKNKYEKGGHFKEDKGHSDAAGHEEHHAHVNKYGKKEENSGGKKWKFKKGDGDGGDSHGKHSEQKQTVSKREGMIHKQPKGEHFKESFPSDIYDRNRILLSPMFIYSDMYNSKTAKIEPSNQNKQYLVNEPENENDSNREAVPVQSEQQIYSNIKQSEIPIILTENDSEIITKNYSQGRESLQEDASAANNQAEKPNTNSATQRDVVNTDQIYEEYKILLNRKNPDWQRRPNRTHEKYKNDEYHPNADKSEPEIQTESTYLVRRSNYQMPFRNSTPDFSKSVKNELKKEAPRHNDEFCGTHDHDSSTGRTRREADDMVEVFNANHNEDNIEYSPLMQKTK